MLRRGLICVAGVVLFGGGLGFAQAGAAVGAGGQTTAGEVKPLAFDVVSIRPVKATGGRPDFGPTPSGFHIGNGPMMVALLTAYTPSGGGDSGFYTRDRIMGMPEWALMENYNVDAKVSDADVAAWQKPGLQTPMLRSMLQAMLADRCKAVVHRATKETAVYSLVVGKGGPKFKESVPGARIPAGKPLPGGAVTSFDGTKEMNFYNAEMGSVVAYLSVVSGRPVLDKTGLTGRYDLEFRRPGMGGPDDESGASVFAVVQDELGLKLEPGKGEVETLVIDRLERPSEN
jgi:uncharacterized protein (TIGR03435 family)